MSKKLLGEFEHHVLLALLRQGDEGYSVPIIGALEERTGREVAPAAARVAGSAGTTPSPRRECPGWPKPARCS